MTSHKEPIIIIGAGAAGLYAGFLLQQQGMEFLILEASDKIGGRIAKHQFGPLAVDTGAQWLHGGIPALTGMIPVEEQAVFLDRSPVKYWYRSMLQDELPWDVQKRLDALEVGVDQDLPFTDFFLQNGGDSRDLPLVTGYAGDVGASPQHISAKWEARGYDATTYSEEDYLFRGTYFDAINDYLVPSIRDFIQLQTVVREVNYEEDIVKVITSENVIFTASRVIITVPITILKEGDITFKPALSAEKVRRFHQLGMEAGMKVFLRFTDCFTTSDIFGGPICASYACEFYAQNSDELVVQAYLMGDQAKALHDMGEEQAVAALLAELDLFFAGRASTSYVDHFIQDWYQHPYIRGAYSYPLVGSDLDTRKVIAEPVANKLFFAGEATHLQGHHQTVQGALETARREVNRILEVTKVI